MKRRLNYFERTLWVDGLDSFAIALGITLRGHLTIVDCEEAIRKARQKHALMGVRIALGKARTPWFVSDGVPECPIRVINREGDEDLLRELKSESALPFAWEIGPLVRFVLITSLETTDFILTCHHCVADGLATMILLQDIMCFIANPDLDVEEMPELPPLEAILPPKILGIMGPFLAVQKSEEEDPVQFLDLSTAELVCDTQKNSISNRSRQPPNQFVGNDGGANCNPPLPLPDRKVRVHSAICTSFGNTFKTIATPANLRHRFSPPIGDYSGTFAWSVYVLLRARLGQGFWVIARRYQRKLTSELKHLSTCFGVGDPVFRSRLRRSTLSAVKLTLSTLSVTKCLQRQG